MIWKSFIHRVTLVGNRALLAMDKDRKVVCLYLTNSEEELIEGIFRWNNMELVKATKDDHARDQDKQLPAVSMDYQSAACANPVPAPIPAPQTLSPLAQGPTPQAPAPLPSHLPGFRECPLCFILLVLWMKATDRGGGLYKMLFQMTGIESKGSAYISAFGQHYSTEMLGKIQDM